MSGVVFIWFLVWSPASSLCGNYVGKQHKLVYLLNIFSKYRINSEGRNFLVVHSCFEFLDFSSGNVTNRFMNSSNRNLCHQSIFIMNVYSVFENRYLHFFHWAFRRAFCIDKWYLEPFSQYFSLTSGSFTDAVAVFVVLPTIVVVIKGIGIRSEVVTLIAIFLVIIGSFCTFTTLSYSTVWR